MATIYEKVAGDNTLILGVRELFIYPFDMGDWNEIRISYWLSLTSSSSFNAAYVDEYLYGQAAHTGYREAGFWGIKDSGTSFPTQTGSVFMGVGRTRTDTSQNAAVLVSETISYSQDGPAAGRGSFNSGTEGVSTQVANIQVSSTANSIGTTNYGSFYSQKIVRTRNAPGGKTGVYFYTYAERNVATPYDFNTTRIKALGTTYNASYYQTGYWTTDFTVNGNHMSQFPNSIFIYHPFYNSRLRLHTIVIDKIS